MINFLIVDSRNAVLNRKSPDVAPQPPIQQQQQQGQQNSGGPGGRSTPTPIGAVTVPPAVPHSPILEDTSTSNNTVSTVEEQPSSEKPTMAWDAENGESESHTIQNSELLNLDLDEFLKIESLPLLTVRYLDKCIYSKLDGIYLVFDEMIAFTEWDCC